jgi:hypothetical protein
MAKKPTPEKAPDKKEASVASKAMRTGKASEAEIRSMAARLEQERKKSVKLGEKKPTDEMSHVTGRAMRTGKATEAEIRSMGARLESERSAAKKAPAKKK